MPSCSIFCLFFCSLSSSWIRLRMWSYSSGPSWIVIVISSPPLQNSNDHLRCQGGGIPCCLQYWLGGLRYWRTSMLSDNHFSSIFSTISAASLIPIFGVRGLDAALPYQRRTRKLPH